ncbi:putative arrestin-related trafficking adapter C2D10.04 [Choanephora cucurbitarum]|uniref:Putative arrestin-related trafficking adapter C2D10.04 n=1 Tax=Choanephora cucurbitarum TaxID=101091 RepID=A0A1C7NFN0_9FUNG|nr:putative arrestin-related trafficking adapter C2D10.04 [Choanephora cucurbitarum]
MPVVVPFFTGAKQLTIELAEPVVILRGSPADNITHVLQGEVSVVLTRPVSISQVVVQFIGKTTRLWPEGLAGGRLTNSFHERTIHEQDVILQSFPENPKQEGVLPAGTHRWPFQFLLSSYLAETIEDQMGQVFYYIVATVHRVGVGATKLRSRYDVLLLRTPNWSDNALAGNSLPTTSITSERQLDICDANICIEKSIVAGGAQLPISFCISPNMKHVFIESMTVILREKKVYRMPELHARRSESYDYKVTLHSICEPSSSSLESGSKPAMSLKDLKKALGLKNAHISLNENPFQHRIIFNLPGCMRLNHSTTYSEIDIQHTLKVHIELSSPFDANSNDTAKTDICFETPFTVLDCRLKEDCSALPTYEQAMLDDSAVDHQDLPSDSNPTNFFPCPCYLEYKKKRNVTRRDWIKFRNESTQSPTSPSSLPSSSSIPPPPSYDSL